MHVEISTINRHFKHVFCPISRIRRNHEKKTLQLIFLSLQGPASGTAYGNRTHDSAVRGLRLNLLTNAAYFVFVSRDKCYYTDASGALQGKNQISEKFFCREFCDGPIRCAAARPPAPAPQKIQFSRKT